MIYEGPEIVERNIKDELLYNDVPVLNYSLTYPEMTGGKQEKRINAYYISQTKRQEAYIKNRLFKGTVSRYKKSVAKNIPFSETQFYSDFQTAWFNDFFLSLFQDFYEYTGGANGQTVRLAQTWLLENGRRLRLSDFFKRRTKWRNTMIETIELEIKKQISEEDASYFDNWELLIRRYFNQNNYYLTKEGFAVFYQETTIAPHSSGVVVFTVPYYVFSEGMVFDLQKD